MIKKQRLNLLAFKGHCKNYETLNLNIIIFQEKYFKNIMSKTKFQALFLKYVQFNFLAQKILQILRHSLKILYIFV